MSATDPTEDGHGTVVATANVLYTLPRAQARRALRCVLEHRPDLVGLQEWYLPRLGLLSEFGSVAPVPGRGLRFGGRRHDHGGYVWSAPLLGDCVVGARADRYEPLGCRSRLLSGIGRAEKPDRWLGIEPPRWVTVACYRDRRDGRVVSLFSYHLVPGTQAQGRYRDDDRPRLSHQHRAEVRRLQRLVADELSAGRTVYATGDSNFDGLRIEGLTSCWAGRESEPGTLGHRKIDDVFGPSRPASVVRVTTPSDHQALVASWPAYEGLPH